MHSHSTKNVGTSSLRAFNVTTKQVPIKSLTFRHLLHASFFFLFFFWIKLLQESSFTYYDCYDIVNFDIVT